MLARSVPVVRASAAMKWNRVVPTATLFRAHGSPLVSLRSFSTTNPTNPPSTITPDTPTLNTTQIRDIVTNLSYNRIANDLSQRAADKITFQSFSDLVAKHGVSKGDAAEVAQRLHAAGSIIYVPQARVVYTHPERVVSAVLKALDLSDVSTINEIQLNKEELARLEQEIVPLQETYAVMQKRAYKYADRVIWTSLAAVLLQYGALARLTFFELSWDIVEPISFYWSFSFTLMGVIFFAATKTEFSYDGIRNMLYARKMRRLIKKTGFEDAKFTELKDHMEKIRHRIVELERRVTHTA